MVRKRESEKKKWKQIKNKMKIKGV